MQMPEFPIVLDSLILIIVIWGMIHLNIININPSILRRNDVDFINRFRFPCKNEVAQINEDKFNM